MVDEVNAEKREEKRQQVLNPLIPLSTYSLFAFPPCTPAPEPVLSLVERSKGSSAQMAGSAKPIQLLYQPQRSNMQWTGVGQSKSGVGLSAPTYALADRCSAQAGELGHTLTKMEVGEWKTGKLTREQADKAIRNPLISLFPYSLVSFVPPVS